MHKSFRDSHFRNATADSARKDYSVRNYSGLICVNKQKKQLPYKYKTVEHAEDDIRDTFKHQMNIFINRKIQSLTNKRQQDIVRNTITNVSQLSNPQLSKFRLLEKSPRNIKQMKVCELLGKAKTKIQKMVAEPYLMNDKQRISRIINLRMQQQQKYDKMNNNIRKKTNKNNTKYSILDQKNIKMVGVNQWVNGLLLDVDAQSHRYRKRLINKHNKMNTIDNIS